MVLYSVITTYHLLEAIVHKLNYNRDKTGILFISHWLENKYPWYKSLEVFFDKVIVFNANYAVSVHTDRELQNTFKRYFISHEVVLDSLDEIHVFGAEHSFGAFIFSNAIENYFWEEGAGALSKSASMYEIFKKTHGVEKAEYQCNLHLEDGNQPFVKGRYYNKYFQEKLVEGENLCHFDLSEELEALDACPRGKITELFYGQEHIEADSGCALLLTEHFANLSIMTWEEQILLYRYMVDYFLSKYRLLIKPHPDDLMYYEYIFDNCRVIRTKFPAELLPFIFEGKPEVVATSSSTSIYGLRKLYDKVLEFNFKFSHNKQFYNLNRYFAALSVADGYIRKGHKLKLLGVNPAYVDNFRNFHGLCDTGYEELGSCADALIYTPGEKAVWLIDETELSQQNAGKVCTFLEQLDSDSLVIFVNSKEDFCFYDATYKNQWSWIRPVEVKLSVNQKKDSNVTIGGPSLVHDHTEMIYVFRKGEKVDIFSVKRDLPNVGATVSSSGFDAQEEKIKILEGMLEATEKRLLYFMEREKELLKELEEKKA